MNSNYQRHIDILRAFAVLLVIFHHLKIPYFNGGFIGVDIFLVISGYLITKNIKNEKLNTANFSFKNFYNRRVIRLAPSFFFVILTSMIAFFFILTPEEWGEFLKTAIASIFLTSNIYYTSLLNNYFTINSETTPLLHLWSLGLEEQFYLIWPILLILLLKFKHKTILIVILLAIIFLIFISHIHVTKNPIAAYYLLSSRFFEFLFGAILNFIKPVKIPKNISFLIGIFLILLLIITSTLINQDSIFPSYIAAIPCLLSALYIIFASGFQHEKIKALEYIGKISYPMYLWHWPIISYLTILSFSLNTTQKILIICLTILLSIVTYEFIEKKISKKFINNNKSFIYLFMLPAIPVFLAYLYHINFYDNKNKDTAHESSTFSIKCIDNSNHPLDSCYFGKKENSNIDILLVGDSHANSQSGMIDILAKKANLKGYEITFSVTAFLIDLDRYEINRKTNEIKKVEQFSNINTFIENHIKDNHYKYIVMGGHFPQIWERSIYFSSSQEDRQQSRKNFENSLNKTISFIIKNGAQPIIINDNPVLMNIDVNCHLRLMNNKETCKFPRSMQDDYFKEWNIILESLKKTYPQLIIIDFTNIICNKNSCFSSLDNISLYRDQQHLTYEGSYIIGKRYLKKYSNPFLREHQN
ncbi:acyltransferase family protein [Acinetobacter sp. BSP-28]|uniref:acyltransferase family protein n=1 Tax=Acinetobacter sp. BSP-28 TaxID=3344661 RepID=UPI00376FEF4F